MSPVTPVNKFSAYNIVLENTKTISTALVDQVRNFVDNKYLYIYIPHSKGTSKNLHTMVKIWRAFVTIKKKKKKKFVKCAVLNTHWRNNALQTMSLTMEFISEVILNKSWSQRLRGYRLGFHYDVIKWKHFLRYWPFVRGIHRSPMNSPHRGQWRGALMYSLSCAWINGWVNNREAGDLRRHRTHYDVIVMRYIMLEKITFFICAEYFVLTKFIVVVLVHLRHISDN